MLWKEPAPRACPDPHGAAIMGGAIVKIKNKTQNASGKRVMLEGFEPPTFGSGIQRAAVAP